MARRTYGQYCGIAHALDILGERWTLLIVRELLSGPKRYKDLLSLLNGIGTNLLAQRLKHLEEQGLATRTHLPPPASTDAYVLTDEGRTLEPILLDLARWGYPRLPAPNDEKDHRPGWSLLALQAGFISAPGADVDDVYEFRIDDVVYHARVQDDRLTTDQGPAGHPDCVLVTDGATFQGLVAGTITVEDARRNKHLHIEGDERAAEHCLRLFKSLPFRDSAGAAFKAIDLTGRPSTGNRRLG